MAATVSLITGGAGFIGSHLSRKLLELGHDVHVIVRPGSSLVRLADVEDRIHVHRTGLSDLDALKACLEAASPQHVYHLAAETRASTTPGFEAARESVDGYLKDLIGLLEVLAGLPTPPAAVVRAATIAEYGDGPIPYREGQREQPVNAYAASMVAGTHFLAALESALPFPVVSARLALVFGPGQSEKFLIPLLIRSCMEGRDIDIRYPDDRRDLIYIDDVVSVLHRLAHDPQPGCSVVNIATGIAPTMREVAESVVELTDADPAKVILHPRDMDRPLSALLASSALARRLYGWSARTSLVDGLAQTVEAAREALAPETMDMD